MDANIILGYCGAHNLNPFGSQKLAFCFEQTMINIRPYACANFKRDCSSLKLLTLHQFKSL